MRAGLTPWPKLWVNLRSTAGTVIANRYGAHKESRWLGHSVTIAAKNYVQEQNEDFTLAAWGESQCAKSGADVVTNPINI